MSVPVVVNGISVPKLKVAQVAELCEVAWRWGRERINGDAAAQKEWDAERGTMRQLARFAVTVEGGTEIIHRAMELAKVPGTIDDLDLDPSSELQETALKLLGIKLTPRDDSAADPTNPKPRTTG